MTKVLMPRGIKTADAPGIETAYVQTLKKLHTCTGFAKLDMVNRV